MEAVQSQRRRWPNAEKASAAGEFVRQNEPTNPVTAACAFEGFRGRIDQKSDNVAIGMVEHISKLTPATGEGLPRRRISRMTKTTRR